MSDHVGRINFGPSNAAASDAAVSHPSMQAEKPHRPRFFDVPAGDTLLGRLEPGVLANTIPLANAGHSVNDLAAISAAISLKRIADAMDRREHVSDELRKEIMRWY